LKFVSKVFGLRRMEHAIECIRPLSFEEFDKIWIQIMDFEEKIREQFRLHHIDALICPSHHHCAFKNEDAPDLQSAIYNSILWNLLAYPAGVLPITSVTKEEQDEPYMD